MANKTLEYLTKLTLDSSDWEGGAKRSAAASEQLAKGTRTVGAEAKRFEQRLEETATAGDKLSGTFVSMAKKAVALIGVLVSVQAGLAGIRASVDAAIAVERTSSALLAATGSAELAGQAYAFVRAEAQRLGADLRTSATDFAALSAAANGTKLAGAAVQKIYSSVAEAATVMGLGADQASGAITAISQIISKGVVQTEDLRDQLGTRLPGAFQAAAKAVGGTTQQLNELLQSGKLTAEEFLPRFAEELQKTFGPGLEKAVGGTQANFNRFKTSIFELQAAVGQELAPSLGKAAEQLASLAKDPGVLNFFGNIGKAIAKTIDVTAKLLRKWSELSAAASIMAADTVRAFGEVSASVADATRVISELFFDQLEIALKVLRSPIGLVVDPSGIQRNALAELAIGLKIVADESSAAAKDIRRDAESTAQAFEDIAVEQIGLGLATKATGAAFGEMSDASKMAALVVVKSQAEILEALRKTRKDLEKRNEDTRALIDLVTNLDPTQFLPEKSLEIDVKFNVDEKELSIINEGIADSVNQVIAGGSGLTKGQEFLGELKQGFEDAGKAAKETLGYALQDIFATALFDAENLDKAIQGAFAGVGQQFGEVLGTSLGGPLAGALGGALGEFAGNEIGKIIGGLFSSGGDDAVIRLRAVGGELDVLVEKIEGDLGPAIEAAGEQISRAIDRILGSLGGTLISAEVGFKIREEDGKEVFRVFVDGLKREFEDQGEAIGFLIAQTLQKGLITGLSDRVQTALQNSPAQSLEDVEEAIDLATALDDAANNAGPLAARMRELMALRTDEVRLARQLGLSVQEAIELTDRRLAQVREEVQAQLDAARGFSGSLRRIQELTQSVEDFNRGIDAERAARIQRIDLLREERERLIENAAAMTSASERGDSFAAALGSTDDELGFIGRTLGDLGQGATDAGNSLADVEAELAALEGSLGNLVDAIPQEELQAAIQAISDGLQAGILRDLAAITGDQNAINQAAAIERQLQLANLELRIAELSAIGLISQAQLAFLDGLLARAREAPVAAAGGVGGRDRFAEALQELSGPLDGARERAARWAESIDVLRRAQERGRISSERLAEVLEGLSESVTAELFGAAASIAETIGLSEESAELAMQVRQAEFDLSVAQLRILFEQAKALGLLSEGAQAAIERVLGAAEGFRIVEEGAQSVEEAFAALSLPLDSVRKQTEEWRATVERLDQLLADGLDPEQYASAFGELSRSVETGLLGMARDLLEAMGESEEAAAISKDLRQLEFDLMILQTRLLLEQARELGLLSEEAERRIAGALERAEGFVLPDVSEVKLPPGLDALISQFASLGVPLAQALSATERYRTAIADLSAAVDAGVISAEQAADAMQDLAQAAFVDLGGQLVGFLDKYYGEAAGNEELRTRLEQARFALELANLELQFRMFQDLGLLTEEQAALVEDALAFARETPIPERVEDGAAPNASQAARPIQDLISQFSALGVPLAQALAATQRYRDAIEDLSAAVDEGRISAAVAADAMADLGRAAFADLGGQVVGFLDRYYGEAAGNEELRIRLEQTRFALELANLEIQFRMIQNLGLLTEEQVGMIEGALAFARANPPDFTAPEIAVDELEETGREIKDAVDVVDDALGQILGRVRDFIDGLGGAQGRLAAEAERFITTATDLGEELLTAIQSTFVPFVGKDPFEIANKIFGGKFLDQGSFTSDRLLELFDQLGSTLSADERKIFEALLELANLQDAAGAESQRRIDGILASLGGPVAEGLGGKLAEIAANFNDAREALEILGASAEELAQLDVLRGDAIERAITDFVEGLRGGSESLTDKLRALVTDVREALDIAAAEGVDLSGFGDVLGDAIDGFLDDVLSPYESRTENVILQGREVMRTFESLLATARELGLSSEQIERIQAARQTALEELIQSAVEGPQKFLDELRASRLQSTGQGLQVVGDLRNQFREAVAAAQGGDLSAIQRAVDLGRELRDASGNVGFGLQGAILKELEARIAQLADAGSLEDRILALSEQQVDNLDAIRIDNELVEQHLRDLLAVTRDELVPALKGEDPDGVPVSVSPSASLGAPVAGLQAPPQDEGAKARQRILEAIERRLARLEEGERERSSDKERDRETARAQLGATNALLREISVIAERR